jgi:molybdopterin-guanine dinucleotide biosynthesis protein A
MECSGIILAGGKSSRMGRTKALLPLNNKTVIEHMVEELESIFPSILISTNEEQTYQFLNKKMVADIYPNKGPLSGIHASLVASETELNVITACDMPFISRDVAQFISAKLIDYDAVIPQVASKLQPLFGGYKKRIASILEEQLQKEELKLVSLLDRVNVCILVEEDFKGLALENVQRSFFNMNNPTEYKEAEMLLRQKEE